MHLDLLSLIQSLGYLGIWAIVFAESGLLVGFFLPGDSLLFSAGFLASQHLLHLGLLIFGCFLSAALGDNVGYATGHRWGRRLFQRQNSWLFNRKHLVTTEQFYQRHGRKALILARFLPLVRTFAPIVAGIGAMRYRRFLIYNLVGAALWTLTITLLGYCLGQAIPPQQIDRYLLPIILLVIAASVLPSLLHLYREYRASRR